MEKIGEGADGVIYFDGKYIYKHIKDKTRYEFECYLKNIFDKINDVYSIPTIKELRLTDDELVIVKDYVEGKVLHELLNFDEGAHYLYDMAILQCEINSVRIDLPRKFSDQIKNALQYVEISNKDEIINELNNLEESYLCHADFHPMNVIVDGEELKAIDWDNACSGDPNMDAARTYMLFEAKSKGVGDIYLSFYCEKKGIDRKEVLKYLKYIAIMFLSEPANNANKEYLYKLINA